MNGSKPGDRNNNSTLVNKVPTIKQHPNVGRDRAIRTEMKIQNDNQMPVPLLAGNDNTNYKNVLLDLIASKGNMNEGSPMLPQVMNQNQGLDRINHINAALLSHEESI